MAKISVNFDLVPTTSRLAFARGPAHDVELSQTVKICFRKAQKNSVRKNSEKFSAQKLPATMYINTHIPIQMKNPTKKATSQGLASSLQLQQEGKKSRDPGYKVVNIRTYRNFEESRVLIPHNLGTDQKLYI